MAWEKWVHTPVKPSCQLHKKNKCKNKLRTGSVEQQAKFWLCVKISWYLTYYNEGRNPDLMQTRAMTRFRIKTRSRVNTYLVEKQPWSSGKEN